MQSEQFKPVRLDTKAELARAMQRPGFKAAWDGLEEEYTALNELLQARKQAGLTQEEVAARMGTTKSAVSRLEASIRSETILLRSPHCASTLMPAVSGWSSKWSDRRKPGKRA